MFRLGVLALIILAGRAEAACTLGAVAVLPMKVASEKFIVPVEINGTTAPVFIDTGSFATAIDRTAAERLGVSLAVTGADANGIGGVQTIYRGAVRHMRIGNMRADGMMVAGFDFGNTRAVGDGLLGMNMMAAYDLDFDVVGGHFNIYEADGDCRRPTVALAPNLYDAPLEPIEHEQQAEVMVVVEGHRFKALLDSGSPYSFLYRDAAVRLDMDLSPLRAAGHEVSRGIGQNEVATMHHVFKTVSIGGLQINNMNMEILAQKNPGADRVHVGSLLQGQEYDESGGELMVLGADFFRRFHIWISHSSHRVVMQYPPLPSVLPK